MDTNITVFRWFSKKSLHPCAFDESGLSIGKVRAQVLSRIGNFCETWIFNFLVECLL